LRIAEEKMKQRILAFHPEADEKINQVLADHAKLVEHAAKIDAAHARLVSIEVNTSVYDSMHNSTVSNSFLLVRWN
jgi:hypothetical protein